MTARSLLLGAVMFVDLATGEESDEAPQDCAFREIYETYAAARPVCVALGSASVLIEC